MEKYDRRVYATIAAEGTDMINTISYNGVNYTDDTIKIAQLARDTALNCRVLNVDTMTATVQSASDLSVFTQNAPVYFLRGRSNYAAWRLKSITRVSSDLWTLSMQSPIGRLAQLSHRGGIYNGVTAASIISEIMSGVGASWLIDTALERVALYGYLPYVSPSGENGAMSGSAKDNLLKVLFALNASLWCNPAGMMIVGSLPTTAASTIDADRIYRDNARVIYDAPVTSVTVLEHQYISGGELTTLFDGVTTADQTIVFREPMSDLSATGFNVLESGANYAIVSAGTGTLTGHKYVHTTREVTRSVTTASAPNEVRVEDATLVSITNSSVVAERLVDYYSHRTRIECDVVLGYDSPGDVVNIYDPYDRVMRSACLESISPITVSKTLKGRVSALVGFTPWQTSPFEDVRVLLTGTGTWTVPEGVTEVTVVQIGGGQGGREGKRGEAPKKIGTQSYTDRTWVPNHYVTLNGIRTAQDDLTYDGAGEGGLPGDPGAGGSVLRSTVTVTPGQQINYSCGTGGAGALFGSDQAGALGTATVFGDLTSANGQPLPSGFLDVTTQTVFGKSGDAGIQGGKGCSYANQEPPPIVFNGVSYHAGAVNLEHLSVGDSSTEYGSFNATNYSTFGGGAAAGGNGSDGDYCQLEAYADRYSGYALAYPISGGAGGDAQKPLKPTIYGQGGTGGNGGGGRGDYGRTQVQTGYNNTYNPNAPGRVYMGVQAPLPGGAGSDGGDGADGCVILYYRTPVTQ